MMRFVALTLIGASLALAGCGSDSASSVNPGRDYSATIVRTTYGIPHVTGSDFGNMGFGLGYAYASTVPMRNRRVPACWPCSTSPTKSPAPPVLLIKSCR